MSGGTFTITNLGMFETDAFTPIINIPEVAILGVGRIRERVVAREGQICVRPTVVLSLTVDHRAVDGAPAARFLQRLKQLIEEPLLAL
jgi:pyruvate dehydrogenase E2 component (dihydrolipoamide acetyltransferase)